MVLSSRSTVQFAREHEFQGLDAPACLRDIGAPGVEAVTGNQVGRRFGILLHMGIDRCRQARDILIVAENRSEEHTSELQSLMRISYAVFCLQKKNTANNYQQPY